MDRLLNLRTVLALFSVIAVLISSCSDDEEEAPTTGTVIGMVTNGNDQTAIEGASVVIYDANNNSPVLTLTTDADGNYSTELDPGSYFVKVSAQGYLANPPAGIAAVPFDITVGVETENNVVLFPNDQQGLGYISGTVTEGTNPVQGVLVIAEAGDVAYSAITDEEGNYTIYNVAGGSYSVNGWIAGFNSSTETASVSADTETADVNVSLTAGASGELSGMVTNLAAENKDVDVSLVHPITKETLPGLTGFTQDGQYLITDIPNGTYIGRASYANDQRVMDPDRIFKFGEPTVEITGVATELDFDITGSVQVTSPSNELSSTIPVEITNTTPEFTWVAYSSTSDYVIEVTEAATGNVIWGGFDTSGDLPVKNIVIPSSQRSITYNSDGNATVPALEVGKVYRWRVYASKDDNNSTTGWTLISASEDQMGLIKILE
ncbi:carboxypeptidase-like regulatory domain-containing protein [Mangrovivirga sp. M17]|uniref:Carboxypeptidase-like regulatory domain-containing protein n=1 Tax=Mangrovivirga halotolerans TaxID=2993936 RepID=A0ABT3RLU7_9BACT|nr:carboxypeptidase-like regulatory domain-containing protein [Mangrovivirga halotolerans]MCX2742446.1 carboxypeptidase-like regulatory domain-containing protein [Mangrovivirga halotolerans]